MLALYVCIIAFSVVSVFSGPADIFKPCKIGDDECVTRMMNAGAPKIAEGIPSLDVSSSDPMEQKLVEGDLSILKYKFTDSTVYGMKQCKYANAKLNLDALTLSFDMSCPGIEMKGNYVISGRLIILPVEGEGTYVFKTGLYNVKVNMDLKKMQGTDGKTHLLIKNFKQTSEAMEPVHFDFKNLFNGQKDLSDAVHKFANGNWKEVTELVQDPVWIATLKTYISHVNKYLKTVDFNELISN